MGRNNIVKTTTLHISKYKGIFFFYRIRTNNFRSSHLGTAERNPTRNHEVVGAIPGLTQWVKDPALL